MTLSPIAFISPNFRDFKNYWLKAYEQGTTTPISMALDPDGITTVAKLELNKDGFLESAGGALVIPYIIGAYDLFLFPTEAEADANDTVNAEQVADNITAISTDEDLTDGITPFDTITLALASTLLSDGDTVYVRDMEMVFSAGTAFGGKGGIYFKVVLTASVTPNGLDIRTSTGDGSLSLQLINDDDINIAGLAISISSAGIQRARTMLETGDSEVTGGFVEFPTGRTVMDEQVSIPVDGANNYISMAYKGKGKMTTSLDFLSAPVDDNGLEFEGGVFYSVEDLNIYRAPLAGILQTAVPAVWNHVTMRNIRTNVSGTAGIEADQGFFGTYNQVFSSHNAGRGFYFKGLSTSLHFDNCYAEANGFSGYDFNLVTYSCMSACASDNNGHHGYNIARGYALSIEGCGAESNGRAGWFLTAGIVEGNNRSVKLDSLFGFKNNGNNDGWANLLHMKSSDPTRFTSATLTNSFSHSPLNPVKDVIVDGEGAVLVEGYNDLESGAESRNRGYIQHLPRVVVVRDFAVTLLQGKNLVELISGYNSAYGGEVTIYVSNVDPASGAAKVSATYKLLVVQGSQGASLVTIASVGAINGNSANQPSFTWEMVANQLRLTPIGSTADTFFFEIWCTGFMKVLGQ